MAGHVTLATKTLLSIERNIAADGGNAYRVALGKVMPHIGDAYRADDMPFRGHMGGSGIGRPCAREIWYSFHWAALPNFGGRILRLFNRGHMEEGRFIAMLLAIGVKVYQQDANGKQFRIHDAGGHFGGSGDGVVVDLPDLPAGQPALAEFKTFGDAPFKKLKKEGVRESKWVYFVQMQVYMLKMGIPVAFFMAVNKNTDELYAEIIEFDRIVAEQYIQRGRDLVFYRGAPERINNSPGWFECRFCDYKPICHNIDPPHKNCRTCNMANVNEDGTWGCRKNPEHPMTQEEQLAGCEDWDLMENFT